MIQTLEKLISLPIWQVYIDLLKEEIKVSERQALESIGHEKINKEAFYRAKYIKEILSLPENKIRASKMNKTKTPIN